MIGNVLVIGGAGYIGSHMVRLLRDQNLKHVVFDNLVHGHAESISDSQFIHGDISDRETLRSVFQEFPDIDVVMHFAAHIAVGESVQNPGKYWSNNTGAVVGLLEEMRVANVRRFVFSSTAAIFGEPLYTPIDEAHPKNPTSPYGHTKLATEQILSDYDVAYGLKSVCLRYFNASGAHPSGQIGEDHDPEQHLIPVAIQAAQGLRSALSVMGSDYNTPDGTCVRDYIHVCDLAKAHLLAVEHLRSHEADSRRYNLGNGTGFSVREVIDTVSAVLGIEVPNVDAPRRAGDPGTLIACSDKIRSDWGWTPEFNELREIVAHAWNWHHTHPQGYSTPKT